MFNTTITIYNKLCAPGTKETSWPRTVITGASWAGCQRVTTGDGLHSNDGYSVRIPAASMPVGFVEKDQYKTLPDPSGYWTAQNGDVVVQGEGPEVEGGITEITSQFTNCFTVTAVHTDNLARMLPHLRIEGK